MRALTGRGPGPVPPRPPLPGHEPAPPDYIGIGAQRCGTTWWAGLLAAHPDVVAPMRKELRFFNHYHHRRFTDADRERYAAHFARPPGTRSGEWTPRYMADPWTPALIRTAAPEAKLLVLLRDPVERYASGIALETRRATRFRPAHVRDQFARGLYHQQLTRVLEHVSRDRLLVLQFERCIAEPHTELARTYRFVELDDAFVPDLDGSSKNETPSARPPLAAEELASLRERYRDDLTALFTDFPELDPPLWSSAS